MTSASPSGALPAGEEPEPIVTAVVQHINGLLNVLTMLKLTKKLACTVQADASGMYFFSYDDSRSLQACAHLRKSTFCNYHYERVAGASKCFFSLSLANLVDCLSMFATACAGDDSPPRLALKWPSKEGRLLLQMEGSIESPHGDGNDLTTCTYADIGCEEVVSVDDFERNLRQPFSSFSLPQPTLREMVDDLEWAGGPVTVRMRRMPKQLAFSAESTAAGNLEVDTSVHSHTTALEHFECAGEEVSATYKHKLLKLVAAMPAVLQPAGSADAPPPSKVTIDGEGKMKVLHLVHMARAASLGAQYGPDGWAAGGAGDGAETSSVAVTFILYPEEAPETELSAHDGAVVANGAEQSVEY